MGGEGQAAGSTFLSTCSAIKKAFSDCQALVCFKIAACLLLATVAGTAFPDSINGAWLSPVADNWPFVPVHAALTPDGRVLTFGSNSSGQQTGFFSYDVWDPDEGLSGGHVTLQNMTLTDIFCSYAVILPTNGNILISGGDNWDGTSTNNLGNNDSNMFRSSDNLLARGNDMKRPRYYATATPLMDGEVYIQGGRNGEDVAEVRSVSGQFRTLPGVQTGGLDWWYPRNFLSPDGRVFGFDNSGSMYYVSATGEGSLSAAGTMDPTAITHTSTSVMFRPGKILQVAGKNRKAWVIDINGASPSVTQTNQLAAKRVWASSTVLADGKVLVTGGSGIDEKLVDVTNYAEIWDPQTGKWSRGAEATRARLYHSIALLLPDASVLVAGGGASREAPLNQLHGEIYYPPYLFNGSGAFAARPSIVSAPGVVAAGQPFTIEVNTSGIQRVTLLQAGSATHSINLQQRFSDLAFTRDGTNLNVSMPSRSTDVPPGYYLMFVFNNRGVPSKARMVRILVEGSGGGGQDETPPTTPQIVSLAKAGGNPKLTWDASTDDVGVAGYAIYRATSAAVGGEAALVADTTWIDETAVEGVKYWYAVKAYDAAGNLSAASALRSITAFQNPKKPGNFKIALSSGDPKLTFSPSSDNVGVVGYNVYRSTNGTLGPLFAGIARSPWIDTSAQARITYTYAVRARDAAGYLSAATALKSIEAR